MTFWTIFCPVFAALVASFVITELVNVAIGFYIHRKQERVRKDIEAKIASGEINPLDLMMSGMGSGADMGFPPGMPTASGETKSGVTHGQYL